MLTLYMILLVVVALVVAGVAMFVVSYDTQRNEVLRGLEKTAQQTALGISSHLRLAMNTLDVFASTQDLGGGSGAEQTALLGRLLTQQRKVMSELAILDTGGQETARVSSFRIFPESELASRKGLPEFERAAEGDTYIGPIRISEQSNVPVAVISAPIRRPDGSLGGVLVAEVTLKAMWDVVSEVEFGETGYAYVVDREGKLRAFGELTEVYQLFGVDLSHLPEVERFVAGTSWDVEQGHEYVGLQGVEVVGSYAAIREAEWGAVVELPTDEAFAGLERMMVSLGVVLVVVTGLAVVVSPAVLSRTRRDLELLRQGAEGLGQGELERKIVLRRRDELGRLAQVFNGMADQLRALIADLEQRVEMRTRDLARRSVQLQAAAEVGSAVASIRDLDELFGQVAQLVSERFGFYHVGIFTFEGQYAVLRATNSEGGQRMLARGHRLEVGAGKGIVGTAMATREARIALDVGEDAAFFDNPDLPETRSEMTVPLIVRDQLLGALDVQSKEPGAFTADDVAVLRVLADQVAIAIQNARLFAESEQALSMVRRAYGELSREEWERLLRQRDVSYVATPAGVQASQVRWQPEMVQAGQEGRTVQVEGGTVVVPVRVRDQVVGVIRLRRAAGMEEWTAGDVGLVETLSNQLAVALDGARLFEEARERAARDRLLGHVTARLRETLDMRTVLETAANELYEQLGLEQVAIYLSAEDAARQEAVPSTPRPGYSGEAVASPRGDSA